ncbi:hypothetical protein H0H81_007581 [Sphagnurus paluster]|uniref:Uncharacterized protein n=1 Tax=Sphagnurus paluster TaxID=117069 RepID=A0A9P7FUL3_9AGAR|nr:hypothetical protein H0H81_007581 [Sphagnurus paluster]
MARRPLSTAGSSRPYTSNGGRPTTAAGNGWHYDQNPQYTFGHNYELEEEDEEESEDEDVFAFLPPSTAEQQQQQAQQQQFQHDYAHNHPYDPVFANSLPSPHIAYPSPTFDPYARYPADSASGVGPSTPNFQYFQPPPQTPPSTDSNNHNNNQDAFRLRRLNTAPDTSIPPTTPESRPVRVSLTQGTQASAMGSEKEADMEAATARRRSNAKRHDSSISDSLSLGPSMVDEDDETSREGSIK